MINALKINGAFYDVVLQLCLHNLYIRLNKTPQTTLLLFIYDLSFCENYLFNKLHQLLK